MQTCMRGPCARPWGQHQARPSRAQCVAVRATAEPRTPSQQTGRRAMLGMAGLALLAGTAAAPAQAGEPFLASTGGKGILAEEEQALYNLRVQAETEARREIQAEREKFEEEGRKSQVRRGCCC